jgi:hypothetical protein
MRMPARTRPLLHALLLASCLITLASAIGCARKTTAPVAGATPRTFRMGFSAIPPQADQTLAIASITMWASRADAAIIHIEAPWDSLLAGRRLDSVIRNDLVPLVAFYRGHGMKLFVTLDATNGLDRSAESAPLVAAGRSLTEPAIQQMYRSFAVAIDTLLRPDHLGLAAETNLIRGASSAALYAAVKQVANDAAADVRSRDPSVRLYVSVQVEVAWGALGGGAYQGIATDLADFPFVQELGLSSYPYFTLPEPEQLPLDYYSKLVLGTSLPVMVVEGGWTSASVGSITSTPDKQARYLRRQVQLLDQARAIAVFQLTFTDLDLTGVSLPPGSILPLFAALGVVDANLAPKPALAVWDSAFARPRNLLGGS